MIIANDIIIISVIWASEPQFKNILYSFFSYKKHKDSLLLANDPIGPIIISSVNAPPAKNVAAMHNIVLTKKNSAVHKRVNALTPGNDQNANKLHVEINSKFRSDCYKMLNDVMLETKYTPKKLNNDSNNDSNNDNENNVNKTIANRSGDRTVPFWSLHHFRVCKINKFDVKVHEIEHVERREILSVSQFYNIIIEYVKLKKK